MPKIVEMSDQDQTAIMQFIIESAMISTVASVNKLQMNIDEYFRKQGLVLTQQEIIDIIQSKQTTVINQGVRSLEIGMGTVVGAMIAYAFGAGMSKFISNNNSDNSDYLWVKHSTEQCKDCIERTGLIKKYSEWIQIGLPRSGFSVCNGNCKCRLEKV